MIDRGFLRRPGLILPATLAPMGEALLALVLGPANGVALAPQITAPPPLDLFHDLRWISVYHDSWLTLGLELAALLVLRALWVGWVVDRSWPVGAAGGEGSPGMWRSFRRGLLYYSVAMVLLLPSVVLLFGLAFTHLSFLFFAAVPPALALAVVLHHGATGQGRGRWWWRPSWRGAAWILGSFAWLTAAGGVAGSVPAPIAVLVAGAAGLANARAWYGLVRDYTVRPRRRPLRALAPALVGAIFAFVLGGTTIGFAVAMDDQAPAGVSHRPAWASGPAGRPVLVAAGFHSSLRPGAPLPLPPGFEGHRFSYVGVDRSGNPLPYSAADTQQSLIVSATRMAEQVEALAAAYGKPVTIVAESQGALVARAYLTVLA
ncbi:MAG: hypothetical protein HY658_04860, partial [Actinobacteria bacterium]|nr:hypothetical protein [Actinomycetota bacterium]